MPLMDLACKHAHVLLVVRGPPGDTFDRDHRLAAGKDELEDGTRGVAPGIVGHERRR
jgi:hypothetical protein